MKARGKRLVAAFMAVVLALFGLAGCSALGDPSSTEDLLVRFAANQNNMNFSCEANVDLAVTVSGFHARTPISLKLKTGGGSAYGTSVIDLSALDVPSRTYEYYVEQDGTNFVAYLRRTDTKDAPWMRLEVDCPFSIDIPLIVKILSESRFLRIAYDSDKEVRYELSMPAATVAEALFGMGDITTSFVEIKKDELFDALGTSRVSICFNKDCLMRSIKLSCGFNVDNKELVPVTAKVSFDASCVASDYGTVDASKVKVPDEVRNSSVVVDDPFGVQEIADELMAAAK